MALDAAFHSLSDWSKEVARNGIESMPKIGFSLACAEIRRSPIGAWPVWTARLMSLPANSEPPGWVTISSLPPVPSVTHLANLAPFSEW